MTDAQLAKLPKYAQDEVMRLRRLSESLQRELTAQRCSEPSRIQWGWDLQEEEAPCPSCGHVHPERQSCAEAVREEKLQAAIDRMEERRKE